MEIKIEKKEEAELDSLGVGNWPIWTCEPSDFDWHYDQRETCYILEGEVTVRTTAGQVSFGPGDFVTFPQGLDCRWQVKKPVRKHYNFG